MIFRKRTEHLQTKEGYIFVMSNPRNTLARITESSFELQYLKWMFEGINRILIHNTVNSHI